MAFFSFDLMPVAPDGSWATSTVVLEPKTPARWVPFPGGISSLGWDISSVCWICLALPSHEGSCESLIFNESMDTEFSVWMIPTRSLLRITLVSSSIFSGSGKQSNYSRSILQGESVIRGIWPNSFKMIGSSWLGLSSLVTFRDKFFPRCIFKFLLLIYSLPWWLS